MKGHSCRIQQAGIIIGMTVSKLIYMERERGREQKFLVEPITCLCDLPFLFVRHIVSFLFVIRLFHWLHDCVPIPYLLCTLSGSLVSSHQRVCLVLSIYIYILLSFWHLDYYYICHNWMQPTHTPHLLSFSLIKGLIPFLSLCSAILAFFPLFTTPKKRKNKIIIVCALYLPSLSSWYAFLSLFSSILVLPYSYFSGISPLSLSNSTRGSKYNNILLKKIIRHGQEEKQQEEE